MRRGDLIIHYNTIYKYEDLYLGTSKYTTLLRFTNCFGVLLMKQGSSNIRRYNPQIHK